MFNETMSKTMRITKILSGIFFISAIVLAGCDSKSSEKKLAQLQDQLTQAESGNSSTPTTATNTPATTSTTTADVKPDGPLPAFEWDGGEEYDFGTISQGDIAEHTFKFKNNGEAPLIIESAKASCGCTVPTYTQEPVPVGGEGVVTVRFDSKGKTNVQNKTVTITANTYPKISRLRIKSFVNPPSATESKDGPVRN